MSGHPVQNHRTKLIPPLVRGRRQRGHHGWPGQRHRVVAHPRHEKWFRECDQRGGRDRADVFARIGVNNRVSCRVVVVLGLRGVRTEICHSLRGLGTFATLIASRDPMWRGTYRWDLR